MKKENDAETQNQIKLTFDGSEVVVSFVVLSLFAPVLSWLWAVSYLVFKWVIS